MPTSVTNSASPRRQPPPGSDATPRRSSGRRCPEHARRSELLINTLYTKEIDRTVPPVYQQHDFPVHIDRVSRLKSDDSPGGSYGFGLTDTQYEALLTATEAGYFSVPRDTKLEEIADELDVSEQTASEHIRKGTEKVVRTALLGLSAADFDPSGTE